MPAARSRLNFTKAALDALASAPSGSRAYYNDVKVRGLQLVVTDHGVKSFYLYRRMGKKPVRFHLGHYPDLTPENARRKAEVARGQVAMGVDLRAEKRAANVRKVTLGDAFEAFKVARTRLRPRTLYDYGRFLELAFGDWKTRPLIEITKDQVAARHRRLGERHGHAYADNAMRYLRSLLNFAQFQYESPDGRPPLPDNPVRRLSQTRAWYQVKRRTSYVKPTQLEAWFRAVLKLKAEESREAKTVADWLIVMMLTGLRRHEALTLRWQDVDLIEKTLTVRDTKNGEDHSLPLSDYLLAVLTARKDDEEEFVFASYGRHGHLTDPREPLKRVISDSEVTFTPHDLRRTFITVAESLDIPAYALKRLLNHKMRGDITATYIVPSVDRLRKPMQAVSDHILKCANIKASVPGEELPRETRI